MSLSPKCTRIFLSSSVTRFGSLERITKISMKFRRVNTRPPREPTILVVVSVAVAVEAPGLTAPSATRGRQCSVPVSRPTRRYHSDLHPPRLQFYSQNTVEFLILEEPRGWHRIESLTPSRNEAVTRSVRITVMSITVLVIEK